MKAKQIYILFISLFLFTTLPVFAQFKNTQKSGVSEKNKQTNKNKKKKKSDKIKFPEDTMKLVHHNIFIGADLVGPISSFFSEKKPYEAFVAYQYKRKIYAVAELGYEKNYYNKTNWEVDAKGPFFRAGINYYLTRDQYNLGEGFYIGGRVAFSFFQQNINKYPITQFNSSNEFEIIGYGSFPKANVSSYWLEFVGGAKVKLFKYPIYADFMVRPKILIYSQKQNKVDNLVIPGYGKDKGNFNISIHWGLSYELPF